MASSIRRVIPLFILGAAAVLAAGPLGAQRQPPQPMLADACQTAHPHATATLTGGEGQIHLNSQETSYPGACGRFVVDLNVGPLTVQEHGGYSKYFQLRGRPTVPMNGMIAALDRQQCESLEVTMSTYRAGRDGAFTRLTSGRTTGRWIVNAGPEHCEVPSPASPSQEGSLVGPIRYRIALVARMQGALLPVRASAVRATGNP